MEKNVLIGYLNSGNEVGLTGIYRLYYKPLLYFVRSYVNSYQLSEEIVSDVFVKLWERRENFPSLDRVKAFLYISAKNTCLNSLRKSRLVTSIEEIEDYDQILAEDSDAFIKIVRGELLNSIIEEVQRLPAKQREIFTMTFWEDMSIEQISQQLEMNPSAVYTNRSRALAALRVKFDVKNSLMFWVLIWGLLH